MTESERDDGGAAVVGGFGSASGRSARVDRVATAVFVAYAAVWMGFLAYIWTRDPDLHHGDSYSDANVLNAGRHFDQFGIGLNCGLSTHLATPAPGRPAPPYTHYPSGPEWIHQGLKACGLHALWQFRAASLVATAAALVLLFVVMTQLSGSRGVALLTAFFYSWSAPFAQYADSVHQFAYAQLTLFGFLAAWLAYERAGQPGRRRLWLGVAALCYFVDLWLTFEHIAFIPVFACARILCVGRRRDLRGVAAVAGVCFVGLALRVGHNGLALGSVSAAWSDLFGAAQHRAAFSGEPVRSEVMWERWYTRLGGGDRPSDDYNAEFAYPLLRADVALPALLLGVVLAFTARWPVQATSVRAVGNSVLLLAAGAAWWVAMRNHALVHRHVILLLLPGVALLLGGLCAGGLRLLWRRVIGPLLGIGLLLPFALHLRTSYVLNFAGPCDAKVHAAIVRRGKLLENLRRAGAGALRTASRVYIPHALYPELAYALGRPYEIVGDELPSRLDEEDVVWIEYWSESEKELARQAFERLGFPDLLSPPNETSRVFRSRPHRELAVDVPFEGGYRLTRLRWSATLDGDNWLVQACYHLPLGSIAKPKPIVHATRLVSRAGVAGQSFGASFAWGLCTSTEVAVASTIPRDEMAPGAQLELALWSGTEKRALQADVARAQLPPNAVWMEGGREFRWNPVAGD